MGNQGQLTAYLYPFFFFYPNQNKMKQYITRCLFIFNLTTPTENLLLISSYVIVHASAGLDFYKSQMYYLLRGHSVFTSRESKLPVQHDVSLWHLHKWYKLIASVHQLLVCIKTLVIFTVLIYSIEYQDFSSSSNSASHLSEEMTGFMCRDRKDKQVIVYD